MWIDSVILKTNVAADGGTVDVPQELRISVDDGMIYVQCEGLFRFSMSDAEFANLIECVETLQNLDEK